MPKFTHYLKQADIFGVEPRFNINYQEKQKTLCGTILTFMLVGFGIFIIVLFSRDMFERNNPNVVISHTNDDGEPIPLTPDTFNIGMAMGNPF